MTAIKCRQEYRTLLDFSVEKVSKNSIKKLLYNAPISSYRREDNQIIYTTYEVCVGMYKIRLLLDLDIIRFDVNNRVKQCESKTLGESGLFYIELYEKEHYIYTDKDKRFKNQYWSPILKYASVNDLTDIISYCNRLHNLKAFL